MLFNSIDFIIFLPIVFLLYWSVPNHKISYQNTILLIASYVFYGWWDWRFLSLILFSTLVDYFIATFLSKAKNQNQKRILLFVSLFSNLGLLAFFKYFNFFIDSFVTAFSFFGSSISIQSLDIILPVGISFYTFQTLSYTIDVYRGKIEPQTNFIGVSTFVAFFPQLVAGPIERATNLLPQFSEKRYFKYNDAVDGLQQILWGLFKKIVIADNCAVFANMIFNDSAGYSGSVLLLGAIFFAFQIYGDFSGYSDIAIGLSKLFGFHLNRNFAYPYFSRDISEFWRRWHISLSSWFRDYLYISLGGSRVARWLRIRNIFVIFLVSGFWHGANWTFVLWGALHACYYLPVMLTDNNRNYMNVVAEGKWLPSFKELRSIVTTFLIVTLAWVFFRAENLSHAFSYLDSIFSMSLFEKPVFAELSKGYFTLLLVSCMLVCEWIARDKMHPFQVDILSSNLIIRWLSYIGVVMTIYLVGNYGDSLEFIYFQF